MTRLLWLAPLLACLVAHADPPPRWPDLEPSKRLFAFDRERFTVERAPVARLPVAVERVEFPSPFDSPLARNNRAYGLYHRPRRESDRGVIILPIWKGGNLGLERSIATSLALLGYKVLVMPAAYQFDRAPDGVRSGSMTLSSDLVRTRQALIQTVMDARRAATWLADSEGVKHLAVLGISMGGIIASVVYGVDDRFEAGVFVIAGGDLGGLLFSSTETRKMRADALAKGVTVEEARRALRAVEPLSYADPARGAGVMLFAGTEDRSMPRAHVDKLAAAWGATPTWVPRGHYDIWPYLPRMLTRTARHLEARLVSKAPDRD